jgi:hypothetical protein
MFHLAKAARIEVEEEIVIEDIPAFDTLDDDWEETILSMPQVELEIEEEEPEILLPKAIVMEALKAFQKNSDFTATKQLDEVIPLLSQMRKHIIKH